MLDLMLYEETGRLDVKIKKHWHVAEARQCHSLLWYGNCLHHGSLDQSLGLDGLRVCLENQQVQTISLQMGASDNVIPDKFFGRFLLEKSENFDEFLAAKGVNWFLRKMIQFASITKVIAKNDVSGYNLENLSSKKNTFYHGWKLGETFEAEGMDGTRHNITFNFANDTLTENHVRLEDPNDKGETYRYNIDSDDKLLLTMENNGITCRRWFKREN
ncbi:Fatty acid-binding protein 3 [Parelaphostrongylus tenuis]|uniref:Fatty acid-binding protein 3 n=1 Tax=Parelaphostrongylus tenuis TaxID=148309 RepID=A0AAD5N839_PARTN|nr:Fatty acid-binding protein 3 [Parelaphostrongylus tenuis]